jgi:hypothetical protein
MKVSHQSIQQTGCAGSSMSGCYAAASFIFIHDLVSPTGLLRQ